MPTAESKSTSEFTTDDHFAVRLTYSATSATLFASQLSDSTHQLKAIEALSQLGPNREVLIEYLSLPALVKSLVSVYHKFVTKSSSQDDDNGAITVVWTQIASDTRLTLRALESCPDLVESLWKIILKDKDRHPRRYAAIFSLLRQLSALHGGSNLLPQTVATFERSVSKLGPDSFELLVQVIPLMTYFDPKYAQYYASHSQTIEFLGRAFKTAHEKKLPPLVFDQLFALVRFLGKPYRSQLEKAGIFEVLSSLMHVSDQSRIQIGAIQLSNTLELEIPVTTMESLMASMSAIEAPLGRVKALAELEKIILRSPNLAAQRAPVLASLVYSLRNPLNYFLHQSYFLLEKLQISDEECIESGLLDHYHDLLKKCIESQWTTTIAELNATFELLVDAIRRTGIETETIAFSSSPSDAPQPRRPQSIKRGHISSKLVAFISEIGLYKTLCVPNLKLVESWLSHHLSFWVSAHHGFTQLPAEAQDFHASALGLFDPETQYEFRPVLDAASGLCLRSMRHYATELAQTAPTAEASELASLKLEGISSMITSVFGGLTFANGSFMPLHLIPKAFKGPSVVSMTVEERLTEILKVPQFTNSGASETPTAANPGLMPHSYSYPIVTALIELFDPETFFIEFADCVTSILLSPVLARCLRQRATLFVFAALAMMQSVCDTRGGCILLMELISKATDLRSPLEQSLSSPLFLLVDGCIRFAGSHIEHIQDLASKDELERLVLFESAAVTGALEIDDTGCNGASFVDTYRWQETVGSRMNNRLKDSEAVPALFARHVDFLGRIRITGFTSTFEPLAEEKLAWCNPPWWQNKQFLVFLLNTFSSDSPGLNLLKDRIHDRVEQLRSKMLMTPGSTSSVDSKVKANGSESQPTSAATAASLPPSDRKGKFPTFDEILEEALRNPQTTLSLMLACMKEMFECHACPSMSLFHRLASLASLWKVSASQEPTSQADTPCATFSGGRWFFPQRTNFLFYLMHTLNFLHTWDEYPALSNRPFVCDQHKIDAVLGYGRESFIRRFCHAFRLSNIRFSMPWRMTHWEELGYSLEVKMFGDGGFTLSSGMMNDSYVDFGATLPQMPREERLALIRTLMSISIDVLDVMPKDHLMDFCAPSELDPAAPSARTGSFNSLAMLPFQVSNYRLITVSLLVFCAETLCSLAAYPAPSIARPAMEWLTTRFWPSLQTYDSVYTFARFDIFPISRPDVWLPQSFPNYFVHHFHDPPVLANLLRAIGHLMNMEPEQDRHGFYDRHHNTIEHPVPFGSLASVHSVIMRYLHLMEDLLNDPLAWESKHILNVTPEPGPLQRGKTTHLTMSGSWETFTMNATRSYKLPKRPQESAKEEDSPPASSASTEAAKAFTPPVLQESPLSASSSESPACESFESRYNETLEWTDWDELEWFTRPLLPSHPTLRIFPLDSSASAARHVDFFFLDSRWDSHHPFPYLVDPKSIPKDEEERKKTIQDRLSIYIAALADVIVAGVQLIAITQNQQKQNLLACDTNHQLIRPFFPSSIEVASESAVESAYVLLSHVYCREEIEERAKAYSAYPSPYEARSNPNPQFNISLRRDLDPAIARMPEMQDFAWKLLAVRNTPMGPTPALAIHNAYTLRALFNIAQQESSTGEINAEANRLQPSHSLWLSALTPVVCTYGTRLIQMTSEAGQEPSRKLLYDVLKTLSLDLVKDVAAVFNTLDNVELSEYPEFIDFAIQYLRPEDHILTPRIYDARFLDGAPILTNMCFNATTACMRAREVHFAFLFARLAARIDSLLELSRSVPDFPWDDILFSPVPLSEYSDEERHIGIKKLAEARTPMPAKTNLYADLLTFESKTLVDRRRSYRLPPSYREPDSPEYDRPLYSTAESLNFAQTSDKVIDHWRHAIEAPSVIRLISAAYWGLNSEIPHLPSHNNGVMVMARFEIRLDALLTQALSRPLSAVRFISDPYYIGYLTFLFSKSNSSLFEVRLGGVLCRTGLFESLSLVNEHGDQITPKKDIVDERHGTIVLGRKSKKRLRKCPSMNLLRQSLNRSMDGATPRFNSNFVVLFHAVLMMHDPASWNILFGTRTYHCGPGILAALQLDLIPSPLFLSEITTLKRLVSQVDTKTAVISVLRWQALLESTSISRPPSGIPPASETEWQLDHDGVAPLVPAESKFRSSSPASPSSSTTTSRASTGPTQMASIMQFTDSVVPDGWKLANPLKIPSGLAPISQLPSLYATCRENLRPEDRANRNACWALEGVRLYIEDWYSSSALILLSHYGMLREEEFTGEDVEWVTQKIETFKIPLPPVYHARHNNKVPMAKFTSKTRPYFLSNGITGSVEILKVFDRTFDASPNATATEPGDIPPGIKFQAIPYNRVVNIWFPQYEVAVPGALQASSSLKPVLASTMTSTSPVTRFVLSELQEQITQHFRVGFATKKAIDVLNANPLFGVGDVPESFAISLFETGTFENGSYYPIVSARTWIRLSVPSTTATKVLVDVDYDANMIHFSAPQIATRGTPVYFYCSIPLPPHKDTYFPVLSFFADTSFRFERLTPT